MDDKRNGRGITKFADGKVFEGEFKDVIFKQMTPPQSSVIINVKKCEMYSCKGIRCVAHEGPMRPI